MGCPTEGAFLGSAHCSGTPSSTAQPSLTGSLSSASLDLPLPSGPPHWSPNVTHRPVHVIPQLEIPWHCDLTPELNGQGSQMTPVPPMPTPCRSPTCILLICLQTFVGPCPLPGTTSSLPDQWKHWPPVSMSPPLSHLSPALLWLPQPLGLAGRSPCCPPLCRGCVPSTEQCSGNV